MTTIRGSICPTASFATVRIVRRTDRFLAAAEHGHPCHVECHRFLRGARLLAEQAGPEAQHKPQFHWSAIETASVSDHPVRWGNRVISKNDLREPHWVGRDRRVGEPSGTSVIGDEGDSFWKNSRWR